MEKSYRITDLFSLRKFSTEFSHYGDDYLYSHLISRTPGLSSETSPMRIDGLTTLLCLSGEMEIEIDLQPCRLTANSMLVITSGNLLQIKSVSPERFEALIFAISPRFIQDVNLDMNVLSAYRPNTLLPPLMAVTGGETDLIRRYLELIHANTLSNDDDIYVRGISRCLIAALVYQILQLAKKKTPDDEGIYQRLSRRQAYVREFMDLVQRNHLRERTVLFYADQMFISPKYLSMVIRESTGRTATQWIEDFVVLEAKNLLRFSGLSVQQIADELNFPTQSAFGKYFKHATGLTPTEYQRS
ncbi:MAG: helix-turn-helix domain-containing protein [Clostridium sp.]|nr:helix-turn-helix domain-containing protein [Clostridium sp.]